MISVVIRTRNEAEHLKECLKRLKKQTIKTEIIIVDSHSDDNTKTIADMYNAVTVQCPNPFTYGKALNIGIRKTTNRYICIISSHCYPNSKEYLYHMWKHFKDNKVAGVYSRQIPHQLTNPVEYRNFLHIYGNERIVQHHSPLFNNGSSMIDKKIWKQIQFDENIIAQEDVLWAKQCINQGYHIVYEPCSIVEHLHNESILHTVSRYEIESRALEGMGFNRW